MHGNTTTSSPLTQSHELPKQRRLNRITGMLLLAGSLPLLTFCSVLQTDKAPDKLTVSEASYGLDQLKSTYVKALKSGKLSELHALYSGVDFSTSSNWDQPTVSNGQGVKVKHTNSAELSPAQLTAFLKSMSTKLGKANRAQIWFRELKMDGELAAHVELWVEANGKTGSNRHSFRGVWHWDVARTSNSTPWKILRHDLEKWSEASSNRRLFKEVSSSIGVNMRQGFHENRSTSTQFLAGVEATNLGCGVSLIDFDNDGDLDIHFINGKKNRLFINRGSGSYTEIASSKGLDHPGHGHSALVADFTGDGRKDIYLVNTRQKNILLVNQGGQKYQEAPNANGAAGDLVTDTGACAADVDLDGDLDLLVIAYLKPLAEWKQNSGSLANGATNRLYINNGSGQFTDETTARGMSKERGLSLACSFGDFDNDGDPDLLIANDFKRDHLYINDGRGNFSEQGKRRGIKDRGFSMSASWCDVDNDGDLDIHISKMTSGTSWMFDDPRFPVTGLQRLFRPLLIKELKKVTSGNSLFINQGDGTFRDAAKDMGLDVAHWAFSTVPLDFDLDGDLDFYTCNGFISGKDEEDT